MPKQTGEYTLEAAHGYWLRDMAAKHGLKDQSKALRVLLDFAMEDGDEDLIFKKKRCEFCG